MSTNTTTPGEGAAISIEGANSPNIEDMKAHLSFLTGDLPSECDQCTIVISYTVPGGFNPNRSQQYPIESINEAAQFAYDMNAKGANVYVGVHPRKPGTNLSHRGKEDDILLTHFLCVDTDDAEASEKLKKWCANGLPYPHAQIVTGSTPTERWHAYWHLEEPITDFKTYRELQSKLALSFGADESISDPARILRLGGSVSYPNPKKQSQGYVIERTKVFEADPAPDLVSISEMKDALREFSDRGVLPAANDNGLNLRQTHSPRVDHDELTQKILNGDHWHNNTNSKVCSLINRGLSDSDIHAITDRLTLEGYTVEDTRIDVQKMIDSARAKGFGVVRSDGSPIGRDRSFPPSLDESAASTSTQQKASIEPYKLPFSFNEFRVSGSAYAEEPGPIKWLVDGSIPLGVPGLVAAMGGVGKSYLLLELGMRVASGLPGPEVAKPIFGGQVVDTGSVAMLTAEDTQDEVNRRLRTLDSTKHRWSERMRVVPLLSAGGTMKLLRQTRDGTHETDEFYALLEALKGIEDLRLVVVDPLQTFVDADIQSNNQSAQDLATLLGQISAETGATVLAAHHMKKTNKPITTVVEAREAVRGATGLVDGLRVTYCLWPVEDTEARQVWDDLNRNELGLRTRYERESVVRGAVVKANGPHNKSICIYIRNESGVLVDSTDALLRRRVPQGDLDALLVECVRQAAIDGYPFEKSGDLGPFQRRAVLPAKLTEKSKDWFRHSVDRSIKKGNLVSPGRRQKLLDVPNGPFATQEPGHKQKDGAYSPDWSYLQEGEGVGQKTSTSKSTEINGGSYA